MCSTTFDAQLIPDQNISQYQTGPEQVLSVISAQFWDEGRDTREMFYVSYDASLSWRLDTPPDIITNVSGKIIVISRDWLVDIF